MTTSSLADSLHAISSRNVSGLLKPVALLLLLGITASQLPTIAQPHVSLDLLEIVAPGVTGGDGGNSWGAHKLRIVRNELGVFTVYVTDGRGYLAKDWHLAQRTATGWVSIGEGPAGREPPNLLTSANSELYLIGWPDGSPRMWTFTPKSGRFIDTAQSIPGDWPNNNWPHHAAAISDGGDLDILASFGETPGSIAWAQRFARSDKWTFHQLRTKHLEAYAFVIPSNKGKFSFIAVRDAKWQALGMTRPPGSFAFSFNQINLWKSSERGELASTRLVEASAERDAKNVQSVPWDAYQDQSKRLHITYTLRDDSTANKLTAHHMMIDSTGRLLYDVPLPSAGYWRVIEDSIGNLYLIKPNSERILVYACNPTSGALNELDSLEVKGHDIADQIFLAVPRGGSVRQDWVDGVYLSKANDWTYFHIAFHPDAKRSRP